MGGKFYLGMMTVHSLRVKRKKSCRHMRYFRIPADFGYVYDAAAFIRNSQFIEAVR